MLFPHARRCRTAIASMFNATLSPPLVRKIRLTPNSLLPPHCSRIIWTASMTKNTSYRRRTGRTGDGGTDRRAPHRGAWPDSPAVTCSVRRFSRFAARARNTPRGQFFIILRTRVRTIYFGGVHTTGTAVVRVPVSAGPGRNLSVAGLTRPPAAIRWTRPLGPKPFWASWTIAPVTWTKRVQRRVILNPPPNHPPLVLFKQTHTHTRGHSWCPFSGEREE